MNRDLFLNFQKKSQFLAQDNLGPILKKLRKSMEKLLLSESDPRTVSPMLMQTACFELSYVLVRHRLWHHAGLLSELAIDFLNSEFFLPRELSTQLVESSLDVLHSFTPRESEWQAEDYENEFLEHLVVAALLSDDEGILSIDLGFGQNLLTLLKNALDISARSEENPDVFQFAPELAERLHRIMETLFADIDETPWSMDIYRLKNLLQRDPANGCALLQRTRIEQLLGLLAAAWPKGVTQEDLLTKQPSEHNEADIRILLRNGLLYEEPQRKPKGPLLKLSAKGYEMSSLRFAFENWDRLGKDLHLDDLPAVYQATILQLLAQKDKNSLQPLLTAEGAALTPAALRIVAQHLGRQDTSSLLDIFESLLHNQAHAWLRSEICQALPLQDGRTLAALEDLVHDDPSPMVRAAARAALLRQKKSRAEAALSE